MFENIIGQYQLKQLISKQLNEKTFPRFSILSGVKGSGKKLFANEIAKNISTDIVVADDVKISTLKTLIETSYKLINTTVYIIPDIDDMSLPAKNSLLKVLEEPPNNAYWILTINNIDNTLATIRSRGTVYNFAPYSLSELQEYIFKYYAVTSVKEEQEIVLSVCSTPGEIDSLMNNDAINFYQYVELVIDNIAKVSGANSFKIADKLCLKKDDEGYDLNLFWNAFKLICRDRMIEAKNNYDDVYKYSQGIVVTNVLQSELGIPGINKASLVDDWIMTIREYWM